MEAKVNQEHKLLKDFIAFLLLESINSNADWCMELLLSKAISSEDAVNTVF
jgi:hypothetical protein